MKCSNKNNDKHATYCERNMQLLIRTLLVIPWVVGRIIDVESEMGDGAERDCSIMRIMRVLYISELLYNPSIRSRHSSLYT